MILKKLLRTRNHMVQVSDPPPPLSPGMSLRCTHDLVSKFQFKRSPRWPIRHNLRFYSVPKIFESVSSDCAKELQPLPIAVNTITKSNILPLAWEYAANGSILWPSNLLARGLEILHSSTGLPWGLTLIAYTFALRSFLFPLSLRQTRSTILANNLKPQVQKLQMEAQTLREQGRQEESQRKIRELASFMSKKGINPVKILAFSFAPLPFFMATFFAVRNMASQPIASFLEERFLWLSDLSVADPYYILPAISTATLLLSLEVFYRLICLYFYLAIEILLSKPEHESWNANRSKNIRCCFTSSPFFHAIGTLHMQSYNFSIGSCLVLLHV